MCFSPSTAAGSELRAMLPSPPPSPPLPGRWRRDHRCVSIPCWDHPKAVGPPHLHHNYAKLALLGGGGLHLGARGGLGCVSASHPAGYGMLLGGSQCSSMAWGGSPSPALPPPQPHTPTPCVPGGRCGGRRMGAVCPPTQGWHGGGRDPIKDFPPMPGVCVVVTPSSCPLSPLIDPGGG